MSTNYGKKLLVYVDPGFLSERGHYKNLAEKIHSCAKDNGIDIKHYVSNSVIDEDVESFNLKKKFSHIAYITDALAKSVLTERVDSFRQALSEIFNEVNENENEYSNIVFYMYTAHPLYIQVFAELIEKFNITNYEFHLVLFYLDNEFNKGIIKNDYIELLKTTNESIKDFNNIHVHIDSELAIERYQPYFTNVIKPFPIPLHYRKSISDKTFHDNSKVTVGFFGYVTRKHGFEIVSDLIKCVNSKKYSFILKVNHNMMEKEVAQKFEEVKKLENVQVVEGYSDNYFALVKACDVVIVPYSIEEYPVQTSGVFIDAVLFGKTILTSEKSWMDKQLVKLKTGMAFSDINDLCSKLQTIDLKAENKYERTKFCDFYTVEGLIEALFGKNTFGYVSMRLDNLNNQLDDMFVKYDKGKK